MGSVTVTLPDSREARKRSFGFKPGVRKTKLTHTLLSQVLPSFEAPIPPVTYPEEVEETIGIPIELEPLNQTQLEDTSLNAYSDHNLTLSSRGFPSFDESEPQPKPLPNLPPLDEN